MKYTVDYDLLAQALIRNKAAADASESHGILCGMLCAEDRADEQSWIRLVLGDDMQQGDVLANECADYLDKLYRESIEQMNDADMGFQLFLPDDTEEADKLAEYISEWCQGFLFGFSLSGNIAEYKLPDDVKDIIDDFIEITKVSFDKSGDLEEDEQAITEIIEYVRMGVLFILDELHPIDNTTTIH